MHSCYGNPLHSCYCYVNSTRRLEMLEILSITAATQQPQQPCWLLPSQHSQTSGPNYGKNDSLVRLWDDTSCHHTFSTIDTPRVGTLDYKRRGMALQSSDGSRISSLLPQVLRRLSSGRSSDSGPVRGGPKSDRAGMWQSHQARPPDFRICRDALAINFLSDQNSPDNKESCDVRVPWRDLPTVADVVGRLFSSGRRVTPQTGTGSSPTLGLASLLEDLTEKEGVKSGWRHCAEHSAMTQRLVTSLPDSFCFRLHSTFTFAHFIRLAVQHIQSLHSSQPGVEASRLQTWHLDPLTSATTHFSYSRQPDFCYIELPNVYYSR